jgi:hypothetical protein
MTNTPICQNKFSEELDILSKQEAICRRLVKKFWKDKDMVRVISDTLQSTLDLKKVYENKD